MCKHIQIFPKNPVVYCAYIFHVADITLVTTLNIIDGDFFTQNIHFEPPGYKLRFDFCDTWIYYPIIKKSKVRVWNF